MSKKAKKQRGLTAEERRRYLASGGRRCPFADCGSDDIEGGGLDMDDGGVWQDCECHACGRSWTDDYDLTGVRPGAEEPGLPPKLAELDDSDMDDLVMDAKAQEASDINNGGKEAQAKFLLASGMTVEQIIEQIGD